MLEKLKSILVQVRDSVIRGEEPVYVIRKRSLSNVRRSEEGYLVLGDETITRRFLSVKEARKFMQTTAVLATIVKAIEEGDYPTIRDIYYTVKHTITYTTPSGERKQENTFDDQSESDEVIEDVELMSGILREEMGVMFDAKGRAVGKVRIRSKGYTVELDKMGVGAWAIPPNVDEIDILDVDAEFVLVVEKGAVFERLNNEEVWRKFKCVLVTGKGQPDRGTRRFVRRLSDEFKLPVYVLADADPYGAYIFSVYRYGSINLAHENPRLAVTSAKYLGVWISDIYRYRIPRNYIISATEYDLKRAKELLSYPWFSEDRRWRRELELFLEKKQKVEIEALSGYGFKYLTEKYIPEKLSFKD